MKNKKNVYRVCSLFLAITLFLTGCDKPLFTGKRTDSNGDIETPADDSPEDDVTFNGETDTDPVSQAAHHTISIEKDGEEKFTLTLFGDNVSALSKAYRNEDYQSDSNYTVEFFTGNPKDGLSQISFIDVNISGAYFGGNRNSSPSQTENTWYYAVDENGSNPRGKISFEGSTVKITFVGVALCSRLSEAEYCRVSYRDSHTQYILEDEAYLDEIVNEKEGITSKLCLENISDNCLYGRIFSDEIGRYADTEKDVDITINFYKNKEDLEKALTSFSIEIVPYDYTTLWGRLCAYAGIYRIEDMGRNTYGLYNELFTDEDGSIIEYPVAEASDYISFKITNDNLKAIVDEHEFYEVSMYTQDRNGDKNRVILSGSVEEAFNATNEVFEGGVKKIEIPEMFKDPQDEDFFVPKTQYYHVIERYYPVTYVAEMGWAICSNPMSEFYMCNAYTPVGVRATSARVTWLESVDEFGEVIQSVVKFSYDGKDDIFTAFANGYATFYPAQYGKDEISFDNLPEDFFHNIIMEHFENIDLGDCVKSYNENVIYLDLLPYYETHNYGTRLTGENIYFRYGVQLPEVCNLAVNYGTNSIMQEQFEELDKDGIYEKEEEYFFCVDDVYTGSTYWSGTFKEKITGYSTVSLVKNPDYELPEPPTKTQSTGTNTENNSGIKGELAEGKEVTFGHYEQDGNEQNGKEDIVWEVIKTEDGKALLLSKYILDCHSYNDVYEEVTWEDCELREYLNGEFFDTAFDKEDKKSILLSELESDKNDKYGTNGGNKTNDYVFCLSQTEIKEYFDVIEEDGYILAPELMAEPTDYAVKNGVWVYSIDDTDTLMFYGYSKEDLEKSCGCWWLRTPGVDKTYAMLVDETGSASVSMYVCGKGTDATKLVWYNGIRPAILVSM